MNNNGADRSPYNDMDDFNTITNRYNQNNSYNQNEEYESAHTRNKRRKTSLTRIAIIILVIFLVAFISFSVYAFLLPKTTITAGVTISGIDVGGMTTTEAKQLLEVSDMFENGSLELTTSRKTYTVSPGDIDVEFDIDKTVEIANSIGKADGVYTNAFASLGVAITGKDISPVISYNVDKLKEIINNIGYDTIGNLLVETTVRFDENGKAFIVPGKAGYDNNPTDALGQIESSLTNLNTNKITLYFTAKEPKQFTIQDLDNIMYKDPKDAEFVLENGSVTVKESEDGRYIDREECEPLVAQVKIGGPEIEVPYTSIPATVTADELKKNLYNASLASFTTHFGSSANRVENIRVAASKLNNKVIMPGETFSFNKTVGRRSVANGFKPAPEYQNGQSVTGIGGGTCQVSTTLYNAALLAGFPIKERSNHSMAVSYVPLGRDATVSDGGHDLKFVNDTDYPAKLTSSSTGSSVTINITGTKTDKTCTVKILSSGVSSSGNGNRSVTTTRVFINSAGEEVKRESLGTSVYKPHS